MAQWWDFGIKGRENDNSMYVSAGVSYPYSTFANLDNFIPVGSVVLHAEDNVGDKHRQLLLTTGKGTQIYAELECTMAENRTLYNPDANEMCKQYKISIVIRSGNADVWQSTSGSGFMFTLVSSSASIYDYCTRNASAGPSGIYDDDGRVNNLFMTYPRTKNSGNVDQIGMVSSSSGLTFWVTGFACVVRGGYEYSCPATELMSIPASVLNNRAWFDPDEDAIPQDEYNNTTNSGGGSFPVDYDYPGDDIDFPSLPTGASALGFGKMHIFHPSSTQLGDALDILWSDSTESTVETILESLKKWLYKPEQYCVGIMLMPISVAGTNSRIYFGKYDTQIDAPAISSQWQIVDCGSVSVPLKSNSAFDFAPYTKAMIFLPMVGFRSINVGEIMGGTVYVKYYVDMFTGAALCMVKISNPNSNSSVMYTYECNIGLQIPITSENYNGVIDTLLRTGVALLSAPVSAGPATAKLAGMAASTVPAMPSPDIQTSGQLSSNTGVLANPKPYIVLHFPIQSLPGGFSSQNGFPSAVNVQLSTLTGYTEVDQIHLSISGATSEELSEIESMLKNGVIL